MSSAKEFFKTKKSWSAYKDKLLGKYLPYYFQKILKTNVDTVFIDGFAGQGIFDDGELGSPLIVKEIIINAKSKTTSSARIFTYFIEFEHAKLLKKI